MLPYGNLSDRSQKAFVHVKLSEKFPIGKKYFRSSKGILLAPALFNMFHLKDQCLSSKS